MDQPLVESSKTELAFARFRSSIGSARAPRDGASRHDDQFKPMPDSAVRQWSDGSSDSDPNETPLFTVEQAKPLWLWVVREDEVVCSLEECEFGSRLHDRKIKHTNLTGGAPAYSGGEMFFLSEDVIALNGLSGRYGPLSEQEMDRVSQAFAESGFGVWSMGFDPDANRPLPFVGVTPKWFSPT